MAEKPPEMHQSGVKVWAVLTQILFPQEPHVKDAMFAGCPASSGWTLRVRMRQRGQATCVPFAHFQQAQSRSFLMLLFYLFIS